MTTANHIISGAVIAVAIQQPLLSIPLAYASHFVLDAIPHFGYEQKGYGAALRQNLTYFWMPISVAGMVFVLFLLRDQGFFVWLAGLLAVSPDLLWPYRYLFYERRGTDPPPAGPITQFHQRIQWCERPWGLIVEAVWFVAMLAILQRLV